MELKLTGELVKLLPIEKFETKKGTTEKQTFIIKTDEQYPKEVALTAMGKTIDHVPPKGRDKITLEVSFNVESREYNGKYYTNLTAYKIVKL